MGNTQPLLPSLTRMTYTGTRQGKYHQLNIKVSEVNPIEKIAVNKSSIVCDVVPCNQFKSTDVSEEYVASIFRV
jgi:hypothetical protein